ncbi:MAG: sterol desaturase family protein [Archangiaceae bacterium]|nr:sterol desaturase family protein [Archangiaceae bacterium]
MRAYLRHTRARMFESELLELFSKTHPAIPFVFWVPVAVALPAHALVTGLTPWRGFLGFGLLGLLGWQVTEYVVHRHFFHWQGIGPRTRRLHDIVHGYHHKYPDDPGRLVMPLAVSLGIAALLAGGLALLGRPAFSVPFFTGFLWGYLFYDFMHWSTHHRSPLTRWGRAMRAHHMAHHFADIDSNFGISHRWLDRLLGTRRR